MPQKPNDSLFCDIEHLQSLKWGHLNNQDRSFRSQGVRIRGFHCIRTVCTYTIVVHVCTLLHERLLSSEGFVCVYVRTYSTYVHTYMYIRMFSLISHSLVYKLFRGGGGGGRLPGEIWWRCSLIGSLTNFYTIIS